MNKYYAIHYCFGKWHLAHPHGKTLAEANLFAENMKKEEKDVDVIHEMWLDCLGEWPEPGFFNETKIEENV